MDTPLVLYTIGHSNHPAATFLALLRQHNIRLLVDVRSAPYSRYVPHFNKQELAAFLQANGVEYRYAGEYLGGQPKDTAVYKEQPTPGDDAKRSDYGKQVDYLAVMQQEWYQRGIRRLLDLVAETAGGVTILCSEANPHDCHRHHLITRSLLDPAVRITAQNIQVQHILKDGTLEVAAAADFQTAEPRQPRLL